MYKASNLYKDYFMRSLSDERSFINCVKPESAYLLGLIWGDGTLGKNSSLIRIEMVKEDLITLLPLFQLFGHWTVSCRNRPNRKTQMTIQTHNIDLSEYLKNNNYLIKSYSNPIILGDIPKDLHHYWWRGYFDADGCLYVNKKLCLYQTCLSSTYNQDWTHAENMLNELELKYTVMRTIRSEKSRYSAIRFTSKPSMIKFGEYLYAGEQFGLERKLNKYLSIL